MEAIAFCPFILSSETEDSKYIFYGKSEIRHQISNVLVMPHGASTGMPI